MSGLDGMTYIITNSSTFLYPGPRNGDHMASRVAASMLESIGLDTELVASNLDEYADICFKLATNGTW